MQQLDRRTSQILRNMRLDLCTYADDPKLATPIAFDVARRLDLLLSEQGTH